MQGNADARGRRLPLARWGVALIVAYVVVMLLGLALGFCEPLFFGKAARGNQGIDFFCVPKAYLNLLNGRSAFDTWGGGQYGPYATWFVLHPAVALWVGGYLAWLPPWLAYAAWVSITVAMLVVCGMLLARQTASPGRKTLVFAALLASPITYLLLLCGNLHGLVCLAVTLTLVGLYELATGSTPALNTSPRLKVGAGLLLSLLSKPVLILAVPALLMPQTTRRVVLASLAAYVGISLVFLLVPALNPEAVGMDRLAWLALHPEWVREHLNVYTRQFALSSDMLDNGMHWLHMAAQSDYIWDHVQVFSLPVLMLGVGGVPAGAYQLAALLPAAMCPLLIRLTETRRLQAAAWLVVLVLASHFIGYAIAWEYQYTQLLVVVAALFAFEPLVLQNPRWVNLLFGSLLVLYLPTPYFVLSGEPLSAGGLAVMRAYRVVPAVLTAAAAIGAVAHLCLLRAPVASMEPPLRGAAPS
jgi:hypothetical protein